MAGKRSSLAFSTSFSRRAAPSSRLYSECTCKCTKSACFTGRLRRGGLLPLDRARGLGGDVEDDPVDALDLVDDAVGDLAQEIVRQPGPVRGHGVLAHHGPERDDLRVRPE